MDGGLRAPIYYDTVPFLFFFGQNRYESIVDGSLTASRTNDLLGVPGRGHGQGA
ncbi:hypothetical protein D3C80_2205530 [compost metagenome]